MLLVIFEFSPEKRIFLKQREKFAIAQDFQNRRKLEKISNIKVKIAEKEPRMQHFRFQKSEQLCSSTKQREKFFNFTCITCLVLFSLDGCWSVQNRNLVFFNQNPDYASQNAYHKNVFVWKWRGDILQTFDILWWALHNLLRWNHLRNKSGELIVYRGVVPYFYSGGFFATRNYSNATKGSPQCCTLLANPLWSKWFCGRPFYGE